MLRLTKTSYTKLLQDLKAAERLFDYTFQMLPDEDCYIAYKGADAVQDLQDWLDKNTQIVDKEGTR